MMLNMKAISTGGIIVANLGFSVVSLEYFVKRKKQEKPHPAATMTSHDVGSLIKVPSADVNQSILVTDYSDKRTIISMAWQMSYERLNEADGSDIESGRKAMLMVEAASDIRCALDCGTRCLLAKEGFNYMAEKLDDRIQQCSAYMNRVDIKKCKTLAFYAIELFIMIQSMGMYEVNFKQQQKFPVRFYIFWILSTKRI